MSARLGAGILPSVKLLSVYPQIHTKAHFSEGQFHPPHPPPRYGALSRIAPYLLPSVVYLKSALLFESLNYMSNIYILLSIKENEKKRTENVVIQ